ncbi:gamma carbonic anhydrase family protein [Pigmentiphaga litoralis]|uniref:Carbonic anhydrase/acetyltransferase-like protein (Isoleucine patch superfamily) n=1 Tax=Pigmentiphaga litoralis TaxID=516702 RepID=A0A7Y9J000_9BURK|nr:gamma carbonic anhydrase family protein [Pigmentiphaga litoralis]NYE27017.1 carbonic anhydrase/acetyltransferase-like protein (isoleucine patch superfamily) [Pigmentiphaga litoralis]NYE86122.1 carbonic anhydrase/acetyltransferase-like protein (isoleucine patch superfamily) [Pigmentiphaga litoralis]
MAIYQLGENTPSVPESAYVADEAVLIGKVVLGEHASIWPGAVLRADNDTIRIGNSSNVQEGAVLHTDPGLELTIGDFVTVGHQAMLHGCTIGDGSLVGIQAVILNRAVIGKDCLVGAGAIVTEGKTFPDRSLILGAPAKVVRELSDEDIAKIRTGVQSYVTRQETFKKTLKRVG